NEKTWALPDGTTFQGSSADYKDLLQIYYTTETARNKASQKVQNTGDDPTIKLLLEQNTKMKEQIDNKWKTDMENKLNYALNKDPVDESITGWDKVEKLASKYGYIRGDPKSDMIKSKFDLQATAVTKSLDTVSKKIDQSMKRADKLTDTLAPVIREFAGITLQKYKNEHGIAGGDIVPVPDENLINLEKSFVDGEDEDSERNSPYDVREFLERKIRNEKQGKKDK
ncbi:MAG: hypothetical protein M1476_04530, partial [Candidatus Thermoplasmatota archaeon]|nr:hypothetical protein [Candidatus Thermoplasmatota archaeon]